MLDGTSRIGSGYPVRDSSSGSLHGVKIQGISEQARETHVLMNNCYRDFAVNNARQLADLLEE